MEYGENRETTFQYLNDVMPDNEDFVVVIGTSHTFGECVRTGIGTTIKKEQVWTELLSEKIGLKVVNLGIRGNQNNNMLEKILYLSKLEKFKNRCKLLITENRMIEMIDSGPDFYTYMYRQWRESKNDTPTMIPVLDAVLNAHSESTLPKWLDWRENVDKGYQNKGDILKPRYMAMFHAKNFEEHLSHYADIVLDHNGRTVLDDHKVSPKRSTNDLIDYANLLYKFKIHGIEHIKDDCRLLSTIAEICRLNDIKFKWFCWDMWMQAPYFYHEEIAEKTINYLSQLYDSFDYEMKSFRGGAVYQWLIETGDNPPQCECGHQEEPFHVYVADKVFEEIKEIL